MKAYPSNALKIALYAFFLLGTGIFTPSTSLAYPGEYLDIRAPWIFSGGNGLQGYYDSDLSNSFCHSTSTISANKTYVFDVSKKTEFTNWIDLIENPNFVLYQSGTTVTNMASVANTIGNGEYVIISMLANNCSGYPYPNEFYGYTSAPNGTAVAWSQFTVSNNGGTITTFDPYYVPPPLPTPALNTQDTQYIQINSPDYNDTTLSTTSVSIHYSTPVTIDPRPATKRIFVIKNAVTLATEYTYTVDVAENSAENITVTQNIPLSDGSKFLYAYYTTTNGTIYSDIAQTFFHVNTNTYLIATGLEYPGAVPTETQNDCTTFDIGCQFQKAIMFLFYPSEDVLTRFSNIWQSISTKAPFGYITTTINSLKALNTQSAHAFEIGTVPFQDTIFSPVKIALGSILWVLYAIYFYQRRLKHIDI